MSLDVDNATDYLVETTLLHDPSGHELLVVSVKGTWDFTADGELKPSEEPLPLIIADEFAGEPGLSSVTRACEVGLPRSSTNVVLLGSCHARKRGTKSLPVSLECGPIKKTVVVTGRRTWKNMLGARLSSPEPFETVPLLWENAYGGTDETTQSWHDPNPVGRGYIGKRSKMKWAGLDAPNLEHPKHRVSKPGRKGVSAGFGYIAPHWLPRRDWAGTYDDAWKEDRAPLLPDDFDVRFLHAVTPDQITPQRLVGGEAVDVRNAGPAGALHARLPREFPVAFVNIARDIEGLPLPLDEVAIHADQSQLTMLWKGALRVTRRWRDVEWIEVDLAASRKDEL